MALITCEECNRDMSDTLDACPHCGFKMKKKKEKPVKPEKVEKEKRLASNHSRCSKCGQDYWKGLSECPFCNAETGNEIDKNTPSGKKPSASNHTRCNVCGQDYWKGLTECPFCNPKQEKSDDKEKKSSGLLIVISIIAVLFFFGICTNENKTTETNSNPAVIKDNYKIGERGPAGGWIFYDKGNSKGGWRYLEAAPDDIKGRINWSNGKAVKLGIISSRIGSGKTNTAKLVKILGKGSYAAKLCTEYNGGNKNDWFLPSKDELNLMYKNLHLKVLGNFPGEIYWSSTEYNFERAWLQDFSIGIQDQGVKNIYEESLGDISGDTYIRAIRAF